MRWIDLSSAFARRLPVVCALMAIGCADVGPGLDENVGTESSGLSAYASKVLLITDLEVVDNSKRRVPNGYRVTDPCESVPGDENRAWNIGHMLKREAEKSGVAPATYVTRWLDAWTTSGGAINGQTIPTDNLEAPLVRAAWARLGGESRLEKAPFKLLAIVNRIDLRTVRPFGEPLGGEVRFVFAPIGVPSSGAIPCPSRASDVSTIILEYSPAKADENAVLSWAQRWHALGSLEIGPDYRAALAVLTEEVINSGRLLRIRTNEGPGGVTWKLTEFEHDPGTKFLRRSTIKQSPTEALHTQTSTQLGTWIRDNEEQLLGTQPVPRTFRRAPIKTYALPDRFPGTSTWLRGSFNELVGSNTNNFWNAKNPGMFQPSWNTARHLFSLATCSGCHGNETSTGLFHIQHRQGGSATLSDFLTGRHSVTDPVTGESREFNEMARREEDLSWLLSGGWVGVPVFRNEHTGGQSAANAYKVVFGHSNKCLDVEGNNNQNDNAPLKQYACHGRGNQRFALIDRGSSAVSVFAKHSGKCLDVENASTADKAKVVQKTCNGSLSQRLAMYFSGSQTGRFLRFEHSGKCLRVLDNGTADTTQVVQETCDPSSTDARAFRFVE